MALGIARRMYIQYEMHGLRRRGGNISVELSSFVLISNTNFMKKLKFNDNKLKMFSPTVKISFNLQNHPTFYSEERLVN